MLIQRSQHAAVNDVERGAEPFYQPRDVDMAGAGLEVSVVPECLSGGVKLVQVPEQVHSVRRQLVQVQFGQQSGELLSERPEAVPLLLLEVRLQRLGGQSRIVVPVELAALRRLANGLLQREFQRVPVVIRDRRKKAVIGSVRVSPCREDRLCGFREALCQPGVTVVVADARQVPEVFRSGQRAEQVTHPPQDAAIRHPRAPRFQA